MRLGADPVEAVDGAGAGLDPGTTPVQGVAGAEHPSAIQIAILALVGMLVITATFYPGYLNGDPTWQLARARDGFLDDWHPPVMSWLWRRVDHLLPGTGGMFLLQVAMCWAGFALLAHTALQGAPVAASLAMLAMGFYPVVIALISTIWKDVQHGAAMTLAFACLYRAHRRRSMRWLVAAVLPLSYATFLRYNGFAAIVPLVVWAVAIARDLRVSKPSWWRTAAFSALACGALVAAIVAFNRRVVRARLHTEQHIMLFDLAALSVAQSRNLLPDYLKRRGISLDEMRRTYTPDTSELFLWVDPGRTRSYDPADLSDLRRHWLHEIFSDPKDYLVHRFRAFAALLGIGRRTVYFPFLDGTAPTDAGLVALQHQLRVGWERGSFALAIERRLHAIQDTFFFRGWVYLLLNLAALVFGVFQRRQRWCVPILVLGASGTLYLGAYLFVSPASDFRYNWWGCLTVLLMVPIVLGRWLAPEAPRRRDSNAIGIAKRPSMDPR